MLLLQENDLQNVQVLEATKRAVAQAAQGAHTDDFNFPLSMGAVSEDVDSQGATCLTVDCVFNSEVLHNAQTHRHVLEAHHCYTRLALTNNGCRSFKMLLVGLIMQQASLKLGLHLDDGFKLPKLRYKGERKVHYIRGKEDC